MWAGGGMRARVMAFWERGETMDVPPYAEGGDRVQTGGKSVKRSSCPGSGGGGSEIMERW